MVAIVMSVYNGAKFLREQIDSILSQTYGDFVLLIRDDGSSDNTVDIIKSYTDPRIVLEVGQNIGPSASFFHLLRLAEKKKADHVFFSDQDDIWELNKVEIFLTKFAKQTEAPQLVFSDFSLIGEKGSHIADSYVKYANLRLPKDGDFFPKLVAQPYVFGCACAINSALLHLVIDPPAEIEMYDCWIALSAAVLGKIEYISVPTIKHRFHTQNATGQISQNRFSTRLRRITLGFRQQCANTKLRLMQIKLLHEKYQKILSLNWNRRLLDLCESLKKGHLYIMHTLRIYGVARGTTVQNMFFYLTVLLFRGDIM
mgnify:CR=1 FL=1